jgi:hypothetical protein
MYKKIVGILSCMLLIFASIIPVTGAINEKNEVNTDGFEPVPIVDFMDINGGLLGITTVIMNLGDAGAKDIYWEMRASGGLFCFPKVKSGNMSALLSGGIDKISVFPFIGLGIITIEFYCRFRIDGSFCDAEFEIKQEWRDRALLFYHTFPEEIQPEKEWVEVEEFIYHDTDDPEVELMYQGILNMHNVRVATSSDSYPEVEFKAACKFEGGIGHLKECWITRELVEGGIGHWEVELVDGE